jgi:hypothetical protein
VNRLAAAAISVVLAGCSTHAECVPGASVACACPSGAQGAQVCQADRTFGPCACAVDAGAGDAPVSEDALVPPFDASTGLEAASAYFGLEEAVYRAVDLALVGLNGASSANLPAETGNGDISGTLTVTGHVDQGVSDNKTMNVATAFMVYQDRLPTAEGGAASGITYDTDAVSLPMLSILLRNIPNGSFTGSLSGALHMSGKLNGDVVLVLAINGSVEPVPGMPGKIQRVPGTTYVTGTATSDYGTYRLDLPMIVATASGLGAYDGKQARIAVFDLNAGAVIKNASALVTGGSTSATVEVSAGVPYRVDAFVDADGNEVCEWGVDAVFSVVLPALDAGQVKMVALDADATDSHGCLSFGSGTLKLTGSTLPAGAAGKVFFAQLLKLGGTTPLKLGNPVSGTVMGSNIDIEFPGGIITDVLYRVDLYVDDNPTNTKCDSTDDVYRVAPGALGGSNVGGELDATVTEADRNPAACGTF